LLGGASRAGRFGKITDVVIEKILRYLGLWETRRNDPPKSSNKPLTNRKGELTCDIAYSQLPPIDYWTQ